MLKFNLDLNKNPQLSGMMEKNSFQLALVFCDKSFYKHFWAFILLSFNHTPELSLHGLYPIKRSLSVN